MAIFGFGVGNLWNRWTAYNRIYLLLPTICIITVCFSLAMTTAARPTFEPARGGQGRGENDLSALSVQYSSRDLPSHTKLKYRSVVMIFRRVYSPKTYLIVLYSSYIGNLDRVLLKNSKNKILPKYSKKKKKVVLPKRLQVNLQRKCYSMN